MMLLRSFENLGSGNKEKRDRSIRLFRISDHEHYPSLRNRELTIDAYEFDPPVVPIIGLGWLIGVATLAEFRLLDGGEILSASPPAIFVLGCFALGLSSFVLQRILKNQFKVTVLDILILITYVAIGLSSLPAAVGVGAVGLCADSFLLKSGKGFKMSSLLAIERLGALLGTVYAGASFAQLLTTLTDG